MEWFDRVFLDHRDSMMMMMMVMMWQRAKSSMFKTVSLTQGNPTYWKCWEFSCTEMLCSLWLENIVMFMCFPLHSSNNYELTG